MKSLNSIMSLVTMVLGITMIALVIWNICTLGISSSVSLEF